MVEKLSNYIDKEREKGLVSIVKLSHKQLQRFNDEMKHVRRESKLKQARSEIAASKVILNA